MFMSREAAVLKCIEENPNMDYSVHDGKTLQTSLMGEIGFHLNIYLFMYLSSIEDTTAGVVDVLFVPNVLQELQS